MIRSTDIEDTYKGGAFLRQWSVADSGQAICAVDAHPTADTEQATLDATTASNAKIREALAEVDAVESAQRVNEPAEDTPKPVTSTEPILDEDGNDTGETREVVTVVKGETVDNPDYAAWKGAWDAVDADLNG